MVPRLLVPCWRPTRRTGPLPIVARTHELAPLVMPGGPLAGMQSAAHGGFVCFAGGIPLCRAKGWSPGSG